MHGDEIKLYPTSWAYQRHRQDNTFHTASTAGQYGIYCLYAECILSEGTDNIGQVINNIEI